MRSKKLLRQIKKTFGTEEFESEVLKLAEELKQGKSLADPQVWGERLAEIGSFLDSVDNSYSQNETMLELANRSLEVSTKELYEANEKFRFINSAITAMVNSLDEGFLVINKHGLCGEVVSLAAKNFLGREPVGEHLSSILGTPPGEKDSFDEWLKMLFDEVIPFDDLIELAPKTLPSLNSTQRVEIKFKPIRSSEDQKIIELVVILIDVSERVEAERKLDEQKLFTDMVIKYLNNKSNFTRMIQMTRETADLMSSWVFHPADWQEQFNSLSRQLHTLKGGLNTLSMHSLGYKVHQAEDEVLNHCQSGAHLSESENLIHLLGQELNESLEEFLGRHKRIFTLDRKNSMTKEIRTDTIYKFCSELLKMGLSDLLKYYVDEIVAVPFASLFAPIEANVYSQSLNQDKLVEFRLIETSQIKVIPEFYTLFFEQMVHVFNNMMDHGLESPEERQAVGKNSVGRITVSIHVQEAFGNHRAMLSISIQDDGRGINPAQIRQKLAENQVNTSHESDEDVIQHIFDQGFSTKDSATMTSGRGVGMTAVQKALHSMGGSIEVKSQLGKGTSFKILVPYVCEINPAMVELYNKPDGGSGLLSGNLSGGKRSAAS